MTSLFGRLLPLFAGRRRVEDLFTEAVARLFERQPELCLSWLDDTGLIDPTLGEDRRYVRVTTQKSFVALEEHDSGSRPDLVLEVHHSVKDAELESSVEIVMIESKIGFAEGESQLRRYAGHLSEMTGTSKTLVYITRAYDPKNNEEILSEIDGVCFRPLRWHDFYRFLSSKDKDALTEELMKFMEEQGMARSYRLSTTDLLALSGMPRSFEIIDETLDEEVRGRLESFVGRKLKRESGDWSLAQMIRRDNGYWVYGEITPEGDFGCYIGYEMATQDGYPKAQIGLYVWEEPESIGENIAIIAIKQMALSHDWIRYDPSDSGGEFELAREVSFADLLHEEDHIAAIKHFFIESIRQLREELTEFKKENPDLPWSGGS
jgi:hypothetical protein